MGALTRRAVFGDALRTLGGHRTPAGRRRMLNRSQLPFAVLFVIAVIAITVADGAGLRAAVVLPAVVVLVVTAVQYVVPWERAPEAVGLSVASLDLAAVVVVLSAVNDRYAALAAVQLLPIVVMAFVFGFAGLAVAEIGVVATAIVPRWIREELPNDAAGVVEMIFPAVAIGLVVVGVYGSSRMLQRVQRRLSGAAAAAAEQQSIMQTVLDTIDVGTAFVRPDLTTAFENASFREAMRQAGAEAVTDVAPKLFGPDRDTPVPADEQLAGLACRGEYFDSRLYWTGDPGQQRSILATSRPAVTADGDVLGTVFVTRDVTELTDAIRAREDFLAGVSHELRTPLTSIIGYLEIVQESDDTDPYGDVRPQLDIVQRNAGQLMMRIGDLLHVADEKVPLRVRTVDVPTLVRHAIDSIRVRAANAGVTVNGRCGEPFDAVLDPGRFAQLLDNLVTNAVKYTPAGGQVLVTVGHDERELVLTVRDDGRGIPAGELDRIFERFYRAESVRSSAIGGAGLGLSIVKQIVNAHGGTVSAESQPEAGSTFTVRLPLRPAE